MWRETQDTLKGHIWNWHLIKKIIQTWPLQTDTYYECTFLRGTDGPEEMAQLEKCLLYKHEGLSSTPSIYIKRNGAWLSVFLINGARGAEIGEWSLLASQPCWVSKFKIPVSSPASKHKMRAGEMAHQLTAFGALQEDLGSVPSTHIKRHATICKSSSRKSSSSFWLSRHL